MQDPEYRWGLLGDSRINEEIQQLARERRNERGRCTAVGDRPDGLGQRGDLGHELIHAERRRIGWQRRHRPERARDSVRVGRGQRPAELAEEGGERLRRRDRIPQRLQRVHEAAQHLLEEPGCASPCSPQGIRSIRNWAQLATAAAAACSCWTNSTASGSVRIQVPPSPQSASGSTPDCPPGSPIPQKNLLA